MGRSESIYKVGRLGWLFLLVLTLILVAIGVSARYDQLFNLGLPNKNALENLNLSVPFYAFFGTTLDLTIVLAHLVIAAVIFWRCTDRRMAIIVPVFLLAGGAIIPLTNMYGPRDISTIHRVSVDLILYLGLVGSMALLYLFPNGRFVPPWTRLMAILWAVLAFIAVFAPDWPLSLSTLPSGIRLVVLLIWSVSGIYAQVYRYNYVSSPLQKQQTKWGVFGLILAVMGPIGFFFPLLAIPSFAQPEIPNILYNAVGQNLFDAVLFFQLLRFIIFTLIIIFFPISFAVAILRYRLWDIDFIIRRTLVYGALTVTLALVYGLFVVLLQVLFQAISGERRSTFVTVISTLAIAALFVPLRHRVQEAIDRRFYRSKYDAVKALQEFSLAARDEVDIDRLTGRLLNVVEETMQPSSASLWLKPTQKRDAPESLTRVK